MNLKIEKVKGVELIGDMDRFVSGGSVNVCGVNGSVDGVYSESRVVNRFVSGVDSRVVNRFVSGGNRFVSGVNGSVELIGDSRVVNVSVDNNMNVSVDNNMNDSIDVNDNGNRNEIKYSSIKRYKEDKETYLIEDKIRLIIDNNEIILDGEDCNEYYMVREVLYDNIYTL
ncbi:hypothetical protein NAPIS_ORF02283 [Vairimorpha apis BRL 01]|uniref:Uncharacterized protein n=1 Tax=Vairimorpha apis BRL 01 TaxID=1037528 RepID=T0L637_9MICR|nr:hypothetical protein NAPIS_ORF02283 [Vairimorpha apis BRL 01]